jgi:outer membrane protein TolC
VASDLFETAVTIKQPIYTAGKVRNAIHLAEEAKKEKQHSLETARQQITFRVFRAFHELLLAEENQQVVQETRQQLQKHLDLARTRFSQGTATEIDVLRSEVNLANLEPDIIRAANRIRLSRAVLNNLIVVGLDTPTRIVGRLEQHPLAAAEQKELLTNNLEARPEIRVAKQVVEECRILQSLARAQNKLSIDLDGRFGYSVRSPRNFFNTDYSRWNITANFRLPFYDGGERAGLMVQAGARLRAAEQNLSLVENSVRLEVKAANDDLESSAKAIAAARLNVTQAEKVLNMMQANYQYGAATTLDVVDSQTAVTLARNAVINATYNYEVSKARLRLATGSPILDQEVKLP